MKDIYNWESVPGSGRINTDSVYVTIRKDSLKLSQGLCDAIKARGRVPTRALLRVSRTQQAIMLLFLTEPEYRALLAKDPLEQSIYELGQDGGPRGTSKVLSNIQCKAVVQGPEWLKAIANDELRRKIRYPATLDAASGAYIVHTIAPFVVTDDAEACTAETGLVGIYCWKGPVEEVLYYGRGKIRQRYSAERAQMLEAGAVTFHWAQVPDETLRKRSEAWYIRRHVDEMGAKPRFNLVHGSWAGSMPS